MKMDEKKKEKRKKNSSLESRFGIIQFLDASESNFKNTKICSSFFHLQFSTTEDHHKNKYENEIKKK